MTWTEPDLLVPLKATVSPGQSVPPGPGPSRIPSYKIVDTGRAGGTYRHGTGGSRGCERELESRFDTPVPVAARRQ